MSDQVTVTCPKCNKEHRVPRERIGRKGKCSCGNVFVVEEPPTAAEMAACEGCKTRFYASEGACPACGQILPQPDKPELPVVVKHQRDVRYLLKRAALCLGLALFGFGTLFCGLFHVLRSEQGTRITRKVGFGYWNTFVNADRLLETLLPVLSMTDVLLSEGMPDSKDMARMVRVMERGYRKAHMLWPRAIKALQRDGDLPSDEELLAKIATMLDAMKQAQEAEREMLRIETEMRAEIRRAERQMREAERAARE